MIRDSGRAQFQDLGPDLGLVLGLVSACFCVLQLMPCCAEYPCRCHLCVSDYFCGQHCHKITDVYLSSGVKVVSPCPWCRYCVPFTKTRKHRLQWYLREFEWRHNTEGCLFASMCALIEKRGFMATPNRWRTLNHGPYRRTPTSDTKVAPKRALSAAPAPKAKRRL